MKSTRFKRALLEEPKIRFISEIAEIKENEIILVYVNSNDERGVCRGQLNTSDPNEIYMNYFDLTGYDKNNNPSGTLILTRNITDK